MWIQVIFTIRKKKITRAHSTVEHNHEIVGTPITHPNKIKYNLSCHLGKYLLFIWIFVHNIWK